MQEEPSDKHKQLYDSLLPRQSGGHFPVESLNNGGSGKPDEETRHKKKAVRFSQSEHEGKQSRPERDNSSSAHDYNRKSPSLNNYALWAAVLASTNSVLLGYGELVNPSLSI